MRHSLTGKQRHADNVSVTRPITTLHHHATKVKKHANPFPNDLAHGHVDDRGARVCRNSGAPAEAQVDLTDQAISDKIDDELLLDPAVNPTKLDVGTADGIVTLTGQVNNILAKERSARVAPTVKGVRAVVNQIDVGESATRPDAKVPRDVEAALQNDPATESYKITPSVEDGKVTLTGTVNVENRLKVRLDTWPEDAEVAESVRDALLRDPYVERFEITVTVIDAAYIYNPYVDEFVTEDELIQYERRAPSQTDSELKDSIESELWWSPFFDSDEVNVAVDDGVATLSGSVVTWGERRTATENAYQGRATLVDNNLVVHGDE